jgi:hypothetical protein
MEEVAMKAGVVIEDIIILFDSIAALGKELGHNITWGQYQDMYEMLGKTCIHTKQAARNVIMNKQVYKKLTDLHKKLEQVVDD